MGQASGRLKRVRWRRFREDHDFPTGDQATKMINNMFSLDMTLTKILGKGGQGAACLFEGRNVKDGSIRKAVVKVSLNPNDENVLKEVRNMRVSLLSTIPLIFPCLGHGLPRHPWMHKDEGRCRVLIYKQIDAHRHWLVRVTLFSACMRVVWKRNHLIPGSVQTRAPGKPFFRLPRKLWRRGRALIRMLGPLHWNTCNMVM